MTEWNNGKQPDNEHNGPVRKQVRTVSFINGQMQESITTVSAADWKKGELLDDKQKQAVIKEASLVTLRNSCPAFLLALICLVPGIKLIRQDNSWYLFAAAIAFALIGFLCARSGLKRISAVKHDRFEWIEDTVTGKEFGGRYSHSWVKGEKEQQYYTQHLLTSYPKGTRIIGVKYRTGEQNLTADLTYLHDPLAYKLRE